MLLYSRLRVILSKAIASNFELKQIDERLISFTDIDIDIDS